MDVDALLAWRLRATRLTGSGLGGPVAAVAHLLASQAQDFGPARWAVASRTSGATTADVQAALDAGDLLRTHVLRPTWHLVTAADLAWLLALTGPRVHVRNTSSYRREGIDEPTRRRATELLGAALADGVHRTRAELAEVLARAGIRASGPRLAHLVMAAEVEGVLCSGVRRGEQQTYALVAQRAPAGRRPEREAALVELVVRFLRGHGPATEHDLSWWSGLTLADVRAGLAEAGDQVERRSAGGFALWAAEPPEPLPAIPRVRLLQPLDEYVVGVRESRPLLDPHGRLGSLGRGMPAGVVLVDGRAAGRWRCRRAGGASTLDVVLPAPSEHGVLAALEEEAARYGAAEGTDVRVVLASG